LPLLPAPLLWLLYKRRARWQDKHWAYLLLWNIGLILFGFTFIFLIAETNYRFFTDTTDSFGLNKITQRWLKRHVQLNNFEVRDNIPYNDAIPKGGRRVTSVGDSFTAGHGVNDVNDRFANRIRNSNPGYEVHTLAVNGSETVAQAESFKRLNERSRYDPDVLVLVYVLNDISPYVRESKSIHDRIISFHKNQNWLIRESYWGCPRTC
jgi:lysophospholipase L1-like esterase